MLVWSVLVIVCAASCLADLPPEIQKCKAGDVECIRKRANELVGKFSSGRPDLDIPKYEPFEASDFGLRDLKINAFRSELQLNNIEAHGLSKVIIEKVVGFERDPNKSKFEIYYNVPSMRLTGKYKVLRGGAILNQGEGSFDITIKNVKGGLKFKPDIVEKNGLSYLKPKAYKVYVEPEHAEIKITDAFGANTRAAKAIDELINKNWKTTWDEFSPAVLQATESLVKKQVEAFLVKYPYEEIYLPD